MIKFLIMQIKMGKITIDQVPEKYRETVKAELGKEENYE